jgi:hypothetical protein
MLADVVNRADVRMGSRPRRPWLRATTTSGQGHTVDALPIDQTVDILPRHGLLTAVESDH